MKERTNESSRTFRLASARIFIFFDGPSSQLDRHDIYHEHFGAAGDKGTISEEQGQEAGGTFGTRHQRISFWCTGAWATARAGPK